MYRIDDCDIFTAPADVPRWLQRGRPRFFSRPGAVLHNSGENKIKYLRMDHPDVFAADTVSVGITDNNYGEDRAWPDHFDHVVALNTRHPFSPFVSVTSPCTAIHTIDAGPASDAPIDERGFAWHGTLKPRSLDNGELVEAFGDRLHERLERLRERLRLTRERDAARVDSSVRHRVAGVGVQLTDAVDRYNRTVGDKRDEIARELNTLSKALRRARSQVDRASRECARIQHELEVTLDRAARTLVARDD